MDFRLCHNIMQNVWEIRDKVGNVIHSGEFKELRQLIKEIYEGGVVSK